MSEPKLSRGSGGRAENEFYGLRYTSVQAKSEGNATGPLQTSDLEHTEARAC